MMLDKQPQEISEDNLIVECTSDDLERRTFLLKGWRQVRYFIKDYESKTRAMDLEEGQMGLLSETLSRRNALVFKENGKFYKVYCAVFPVIVGFGTGSIKNGFENALVFKENGKFYKMYFTNFPIINGFGDGSIECGRLFYKLMKSGLTIREAILTVRNMELL